jgi:hypothetical protein
MGQRKGGEQRDPSRESHERKRTQRKPEGKGRDAWPGKRSSSHSACDTTRLRREEENEHTPHHWRHSGGGDGRKWR